MTSVLVTGAAGYLGGLTVRALSARRDELSALVALDVREPPSIDRLPGVTHVTGSVCDDGLGATLAEHRIDTVVHLASILKPPREGGEALAYRVDVEGTRNVLRAAVASGVKKLVVTTSGASYGYHADNPRWLEEHHPLRGNEDLP